MLTRAEREKIKAFVQRAKVAKEWSEKKMSRKNGEKDEKEQGIDSRKIEERKERGIMKGRRGKSMRRGMKALKEIKI